MNITYADIRELHEAGKTPQQITDALLADPRHKNDIMATSSDKTETDLLDLLGARFKMIRTNPETNGWKGPLVKFFVDNPKHDLEEGFELLLSQMNSADRSVSCGSNPETGYLATKLTELVGMIAGKPLEVKAAMDALTGGLKYAGVTKTHVEAVLNAKEKDFLVVAKGGYLNAASFAAEAALSADLNATKADVLAAFTNELNEVWV